MKKIIGYIVVGILVLVLVFFIRTLFSDFGTTSVENIKVENGTFLDDEGATFSGTIKAEGSGINKLYKQSIDNFPPGILSWISYGTRPDQLPKKVIESLKGIVLHVNIEDGLATGETEVFYDLRTGKEKVFNREIEKGMGYFTSYVFNNKIKVATIAFNKGMLDGASYIVNPSISGEDTKIVEINFNKNNLKEVKRFHSNGEVRSINNYENFMLNGTQKSFYQDGNLRYESNAKNGSIDWEKAYFQNSQQLRKETKYGLNNMIISDQGFYPDGQKHYVTNDSLKKEWYSNGEIKEMITNDTIITNLPQGEINTYHTNGQIHTKYVYNELGQPDGPYSIFYKNGVQWEKGTMKEGKKHGNLKKWYNNKQLAEDHQMENGDIDGKYVRYYDDGQKWKEFNYKNGVLHGSYKKWWKNGQIAEDCNMINGEIDGEFFRYYDNGQKWKEFNYKNGSLTGVATKWWKNGKMASKCDHSSGSKTCEKWDDKGNLLD